MPKAKKDVVAQTVLRFTEDHLWVRFDGDRAQIGISDYGQGSVGEIQAVELPEIGDRIEQGEPFGEIESSRTVQELIAPISGTVIAVNDELEDNPTLANEDPHRAGWLIEIDRVDEDELEHLLQSEEYEEFVAESDES